MPTIDPIRTPRLLLRDYVYDDWTAVHRYGSDPEVMRWLALPPNTEAATRSFMERCMQAQQDEPRTTFELAVTLAASGELIWRYKEDEGEGFDIYPPTVADGVVYVSSKDGTLYAFRAHQTLDSAERSAP